MKWIDRIIQLLWVRSVRNSIGPYGIVHQKKKKKRIAFELRTQFSFARNRIAASYGTPYFFPILLLYTDPPLILPPFCISSLLACGHIRYHQDGQ